MLVLMKPRAEFKSAKEFLAQFRHKGIQKKKHLFHKNTFDCGICGSTQVSDCVRCNTLYCPGCDESTVCNT